MSTATSPPDVQGAAPKYRAPEASHYLGLAPATLAKMRCLGGGPPFTKLGRAVVYDVADLEAWVVAQGKRRSTAEIATKR